MEFPAALRAFLIEDSMDLSKQVFLAGNLPVRDHYQVISRRALCCNFTVHNSSWSQPCNSGRVCSLLYVRSKGLGRVFCTTQTLFCTCAISFCIGAKGFLLAGSKIPVAPSPKFPESKPLLGIFPFEAISQVRGFPTGDFPQITVKIPQPTQASNIFAGHMFQ